MQTWFPRKPRFIVESGLLSGFFSGRLGASDNIETLGVGGGPRVTILSLVASLPFIVVITTRLLG